MVFVNYFLILGILVVGMDELAEAGSVNDKRYVKRTQLSEFEKLYTPRMPGLSIKLVI